MAKKERFYRLDGENKAFRTLGDAKYHVFVAYTHKERIKWLTNTSIWGYRGEDVVSETPIYVTEKNYSFGRTRGV